MTILRAADLTPPKLFGILKTLPEPAGERLRCWLDAPDGWALDYWQGSNGRVRWNSAGRSPYDEPLESVLPRVTLGRIFSPSGELRWRVLPALGQRCCRVVFLGDWNFDALQALSPREELATLCCEKALYPLWGQQTKHTPGEWIDLRIPHRLRYPVETETPEQGRVIVNVEVEIWKNRRGEPQFIRLCDLTAKREE